MKFCDKLPKLRKEKNYSQEQLAEKLNVSRQAISKWESGSSYPDMEKMIEMCKILDCTLDQLMDDGVISKNKETIENKNIIDEILKTITKIYNMFIAMSFKQKIKCILEMFFITIVIIGIVNVAYLMIDNLIIDLIRSLVALEIPATILSNLTSIILYINAVIIIYHLFKVRYLNYYVTIEDETITKKIVEKEIEPKIIEKTKEKIIIRDQQHSTNYFIKIIDKIFTFILILFSVTMEIPMIIILIMAITTLVFLMLFIGNNIIFLYLSIILIGIIVSLIILIYIFSKFIFNNKIKFKLLSILFLISIFLIGIGSGLTFYSLTQMSNVSYFETLTTNYSYELEVDTKRLVYLINDVNINNTNYTIGNTNVNIIFDNSLEQAKLKINTQLEKNIDNYYINSYISNTIDFKAYYETFMNNLKNNQITTYNRYEEQIKINIYISEQSYNSLIIKDFN